MKNKTWGEYAYIIAENKKIGSLEDVRESEITVEPVKIRTVGRVYITIDDPCKTRFNMETHIEDKDWGDRRKIYPTHEEAELAAHKMRLLNRMNGYFAYNAKRKIEKLSLPRLQLLCDILTKDQNEETTVTISQDNLEHKEP
ncbi:MAG: hypothetical protein ACI4N6_05240 [Eubacteriales bacterium]